MIRLKSYNRSLVLLDAEDLAHPGWADYFDAHVPRADVNGPVKPGEAEHLSRSLALAVMERGGMPGMLSATLKWEGSRWDPESAAEVAVALASTDDVSDRGRLFEHLAHFYGAALASAGVAPRYQPERGRALARRSLDYPLGRKSGGRMLAFRDDAGYVLRTLSRVAVFRDPDGKILRTVEIGDAPLPL